MGMLFAPVTATTCPQNKCGYTNTQKPSCCAPGGAWFQNCGNDGDTNFDHTWAEGIQACKGFTSLASPSQMMSHAVMMQAQVRTSRGQNGPQRKIIDSTADT